VIPREENGLLGKKIKDHVWNEVGGYMCGFNLTGAVPTWPHLGNWPIKQDAFTLLINNCKDTMQIIIHSFVSLVSILPSQRLWREDEII